jgi:quercetin dioxygenase-like cupin family protein
MKFFLMSALLSILFFAVLIPAQTAVAPPASTPADKPAVDTPAVDMSKEPSHHLVMENSYVRVFKVEVPPQAETLLHRHERDYVFITLGDSEVVNTVLGKVPVDVLLANGETRFLDGGFAHTAKNVSAQPFRNVTVEFLNKSESPSESPKDAWAGNPPGPMQKVLFTKDGARVSELRLPPGAALSRHTHTGPHLVVAVSDLDLRSDVEGKAPREVHQRAGEIAWIPGGFTHTLTNIGASEARFVVLEF